MKERQLGQLEKSWHWWKALLVVFLLGGVLGAGVVLLPDYSPTAMKITSTITLAWGVAALWHWKSGSWWWGAAASMLFMSLFVGYGIRGLQALVQDPQGVVLLMVSAFLLAWTLPAINLGLAGSLWKEMHTPRTRIGRALEAAGISLLPIAGVVGYHIGRGTFLGADARTVIVTPLSWIVAVAGSLITSYRLWEDRPWARKDEPQKAGA